MTMHVVPPSAPPPAPVEKKTRTITLTNRAPVKIVEDDWTVIAEGGWGAEWNYEYGYGWGVHIRVRRHVDPNRSQWDETYIIHAKYEISTHREEEDQVVRVGRILTGREVLAKGLWKQISETGDELRERILSNEQRKQVVLALDHCFAKLEPQSV